MGEVPGRFCEHIGSNEGTSLGRFLGLLQELAARGPHQDRPDEIRLAAAVLQESLNDLADVLDGKFVRAGGAHDPKTIFYAVARDHLQSEPEN